MTDESAQPSDQRIADRRVGPADRRKTYRRGLGRYDRRITGAAEADVPEEVKKLRVGPAERRGAVKPIRRTGPEERRVADRRAGSPPRS